MLCLPSHTKNCSFGSKASIRFKLVSNFNMSVNILTNGDGAIRGCLSRFPYSTPHNPSLWYRVTGHLKVKEVKLKVKNINCIGGLKLNLFTDKEEKFMASATYTRHKRSLIPKFICRGSVYDFWLLIDKSSDGLFCPNLQSPSSKQLHHDAWEV